MNKKGFTLIELLAVIVILAVLALLVIPITTNLIKTSKKEAFRISVGQVADNIYFHYAKDWLLEGMTEDKVFDFDTKDNINLLTVAGQLPSNGTISINPQGKININVNNGVYCAVKTIEQDNIQVGEIVNGTCEITGEEIDTCDYAIGYTWDFDYISTGSDRSQSFDVECSGNYKLEVWGAQGGGSSTYTGGYGGYSKGEVFLSDTDEIFITVGGKGSSCTGNSCAVDGGYNGGGNGRGASACDSNQQVMSGGGATHIAYDSGLLSTFENKQDRLLIVAGGGGGAAFCNSMNNANGGHGGGFTGVGSINVGASDWSINGGSNATGGTQENGGTFGQGAGCESGGCSGAGGGYYGGNKSGINGSGGGSGYIGNNTLKNKFMYCYNCQTSDQSSTYTITGKVANNQAITATAKKENGHARITYLGKTSTSNVIACTKGMTWEYDYKEVSGSGTEQTFTPTCKGVYKLEVWGASGGDSGFNYPGGYGGYSVGSYTLEKDIPIYINVGGTGKSASGSGKKADGGYNGGGFGYTDNGGRTRCASGGGGATHIALHTGLLTAFDPTLENSIHDQLLIVAGGGSGSWNMCGSGGWYTSVPGHGGGFKGTNGKGIDNYSNEQTSNGGTQESGNAFGQGVNANIANVGAGAGGGGGYYGGSGYGFVTAAGGSGYIGNNSLKDKHMYCYNCETSPSSETNTYTISNGTSSCFSKNPTIDCAKMGNGYARITLIEIK